MSHIANPFVAVLDANVLYPFRIRDVLLTFSQHGLFRARFTDCIINEWVRSLIGNKPGAAASVRAQEKIIREKFSECFVSGYQHLINGLVLPDPDDRHVLAAAIRCSAQVIVSWNAKHFPADILAKHDVELLTPDDFLVNTFDIYPTDCAQALKAVRTRYNNPQFNPSQFLMDLTRNNLPKLAAVSRQYIEYL